MTEFSNRVALVTGSSSGIGEAIARRLSALGATVVVNSSSSEAAGRAVSDSLPGESTYIRADISKRKALDFLVEKATVNDKDGNEIAADRLVVPESEDSEDSDAGEEE